MAYQSFEDLEVWQRAGLSVPCNIAEGSERGSAKDFAHFLNYSKGSCGELRTQIYIARKLALLGKSDFEKLVAETKEISRMLEGLRRSILAKSPAKQKSARRGILKA
jgi:four helix bundle protein